VGGFKIASVGHTSSLLFGGMSNKVCYKQCYHAKPGSGVRQIYQGAKQAESLTMELNCIGWASALMVLVYNFMEKKESTLGRPDFQIPQMRYVQAGLAVSQSEDKAAFLLEEYIESDTDSGEWFIKYLNNNSAKPRTFANEGQTIRAQFLSFAQHVQFWKTDGLVFISDLQGGRNLLTDPQIITHPKLGDVFADGNTNFDLFTEEHECNQFCSFYGLSPPLRQNSDQSQSRSTPATRFEIEDPISPSSTNSEDFPDSILVGINGMDVDA